MIWCSWTHGSASGHQKMCLEQSCDWNGTLSTYADVALYLIYDASQLLCEYPKFSLVSIFISAPVYFDLEPKWRFWVERAFFWRVQGQKRGQTASSYIFRSTWPTDIPDIFSTKHPKKGWSAYVAFVFHVKLFDAFSILFRRPYFTSFNRFNGSKLQKFQSSDLWRWT